MKNRLPLVMTLLALPLSVAVACGGDGGDDGSGGSGGSDGSGGTSSGGTESGGTSSGGTESGGTSSGGTESGGSTSSGGTTSGGSTGTGAMGGDAGSGSGAMAGMGGMGGMLPSIADSCAEICDTVEPLDCEEHVAANCQVLCENDATYFYAECAGEYQEMLDCWAALDESEWLCDGFWNGVYPKPGNCDELELAYGSCNDDVYCSNNPSACQ